MDHYMRTRSISANQKSRMTTLAKKANNNKLSASSGAFSDLFLILEQHGIEHLATHIADCGFGVNDLGNVFVTHEDITRLLRVTNKADRARLLALSAHIRAVDEEFLLAGQQQRQQEEEQQQNEVEKRGGDDANNGQTTERSQIRGEGVRSNTPPSRLASSGGLNSPTQAEVAKQTFLFRPPTAATANEYCRQAATFLEHYRVDRAWPKRRSALSRTLNLPTAANPSAEQRDSTARHVSTSQKTTSSKSKSDLSSGVGGGSTEKPSATDGGESDEEAFEVFHRPARHFTVDTDGDQKSRRAKSVTEREEAIERGQYGGSWREVGQRNPDKGGRLDPFPTAKGPSIDQLHAMHSHDCRHHRGSGGGNTNTTGNPLTYETHVLHQHGCQARQCPVCRSHARERTGDGSWQFLAMVRLPPQFNASAIAVDLKAILRKTSGGTNKKTKNANQIRHGFDENGNPTALQNEDAINENDNDKDQDRSPLLTSQGEELVPMWVPFSAAESLILETAYRKKAISILVRGKLANLKKMRWNQRPLRRSHAGDVPFPFGMGRGKNGTGDEVDTDDEVEALEEALRKAAEAERLAKEIRDSFLALLGAEEDKSRAVIEAEEDTQRRSLAADAARQSKQIYNAMLENILREEELDRRKIRTDAQNAFENSILAPLAAELRREEVRRLAQAEIAAAQKILSDQRRLVEDHEEKGRHTIEDEETEAWAAMERALRYLNAQIALFHRQRLADSSGQHNGGQMDDGTRCAKCLDDTCPFHKKPWANHWRRIGGALDFDTATLFSSAASPAAVGSVDGLVASALDLQFQTLTAAQHTAASLGPKNATSTISGRISRARGIAGMLYTTASSSSGAGKDEGKKAKYTDTYSVDSRGNFRRSSTRDDQQKQQRSATPPNTKVTDGDRKQAAAFQPRPPTSSVSPRPASAASSRPATAAVNLTNATAENEMRVQSSRFTYPEQPPVRVLRAQEEVQKPLPLRHSLRSPSLDPYSIYRSEDATQQQDSRRPRDLSGGRRSEKSDGSKGLGRPQASSSSSFAAAAASSGYEPARFASLENSTMSRGAASPSSRSNRNKTSANNARRRKATRGGASGDDQNQDEQDDEVGAEEETPMAELVESTRPMGKPFGFAHTSKQNDKITGEEFKPKVISHYEKMKKKLQKGGDKKLTFLAAM